MAVLEQRTEEWHEARLGRVTGSKVKNVLMGKGTAGYRNYKAQLTLERLTGRSMESDYISKDMQRGIDLEPVARMRYMLYAKTAVHEEGFIQHPELMAGISPDGLVGDDGLIEIKCKNAANHLEALHKNQVPSEHKAQVYMQLWISGRLWCDYVDFHDDFPKDTQFVVVHVERDEPYMQMIETKVREFLDEVEAEVEFLTNYGKGGDNDKTITAQSHSSVQDSPVSVRNKKDGLPKTSARKHSVTT